MSAHSWAWRGPCPLQAAPATSQQRGLGPGSAPPVASHCGPAGWTGGGVCNRCRRGGAVARGGSVVHHQLFLGCRMWLPAPLQLPLAAVSCCLLGPLRGGGRGGLLCCLSRALAGLDLRCALLLPSFSRSTVLARFPGGPCSSRKAGALHQAEVTDTFCTESSACDPTLTRWFCMYSLLSLYHKHRHRVLKSPRKWFAPL